MGERENRRARGSLLLFQARVSSPFEGGGGLIETGSLFERGEGLFNLKTTMVSQAVLHKELDCKVEKLKYRKF